MKHDCVQRHAVFGALRGLSGKSNFMVDAPAAFDGDRPMVFNVVTRALGPDEVEAVSYPMVVRVRSRASAAGDERPGTLAHGEDHDRLAREPGA